MLSPRLTKIIVNGLLFQVGWFACVLGGDAIGLTATLLILWIHDRLVVSNRREWLGIAAITLMGLVVDNVLACFSVFQFQAPLLWKVPVWLVCIWALFATTLLHSLSWLSQQRWLAVLLGAVAAPASYFAGSQLASVELLTPVWRSLLPIACGWALLMPLMYILMNGVMDAGINDWKSECPDEK